MRHLLTILILLFVRVTGVAQADMNTGIIYGKNHAFSLTAPSGWVLDNHSGVSQGLHAVFYEQGQSWQNAPTVMYANTASLEDEAHKTLEQLITFDLENFKKNYSGISISEGKDIIIKDKVLAKVKYLSGESYGNYEAMAYIDAGKTGIMIIMSSRTKEGFEHSLAAFENLVKSYVFMTDSVEISKAPAPLRNSTGVIKEDDPRLDKRPEPVGGYDSYLKWVYDHNRKKTGASELGKYYRSIVAGVVDEEGNLLDPGVSLGIGMGYDEEAYRLIKKHPVQKWTPGTMDGKAVRVRVEIEVDHRRK